MNRPDAKERLRQRYRRRYANRHNDIGAADDIVRQRRLNAINKKLRQGAADLQKEKDQ